MKFDFKNIHIGKCIKNRVEEEGISISRICNFHKTSINEIYKMYEEKNMEVDILLQWCKLLKYDFFRMYSQHLILFSPEIRSGSNTRTKPETIHLPQFRKNIYTKQVVEFILELINTGEKTTLQIAEEYKIPKTTLYKWISKYSNNEK
jgi:transcriptional regulator with PAS, ATPase and Fis domain